MNKKSWIIIAIVILLLIGGGIFLYFRNTSSSHDKSNYEADKTSANNPFEQRERNNKEDNQKQENSSNSDKTEIKQGISESENQSTPATEEQVATFTTKIYTKDSARQNNISITCNTLNETIVQNGSTFSFCNTVGQASTSKGYQKADIFDKDGNKKQGLGGRKLSN